MYLWQHKVAKHMSTELLTPEAVRELAAHLELPMSLFILPWASEVREKLEDHGLPASWQMGLAEIVSGDGL